MLLSMLKSIRRIFTANEQTERLRPHVMTDQLNINAANNVAPSLLAAYKEVYGGVWVGGSVLLTNTDIIFTPKTINHTFYDTDRSVRIPLALLSLW